MIINIQLEMVTVPSEVQNFNTFPLFLIVNIMPVLQDLYQPLHTIWESFFASRVSSGFEYYLI